MFAASVPAYRAVPGFQIARIVVAPSMCSFEFDLAPVRVCVSDRFSFDFRSDLPAIILRQTSSQNAGCSLRFPRTRGKLRVHLLSGHFLSIGKTFEYLENGHVAISGISIIIASNAADIIL